MYDKISTNQKHMKSIKEKAQEWAYMYPSCGMADKSFQAGANYVLDEIENIIKSDRILGHPFPSLEMRYNQIINIIEHLKGNQ